MSMARTALCRAYTRAFELGGPEAPYSQANSACAEALLQSPDGPAAHLALADFYRVTGHPRQAADEYRQVEKQHPGNTDAWFGLAQAYADLGLSADAERAYRTLLNYRPDYADAQEGYIRFLLAEGRFAEVVDVARNLVRLDRERVQAYEYLATALFMTGSFEASIQANRQVISRDSERLHAVLNIAQNYYHLERYQRAIDIYQQATLLMPADHTVMGLLAVAYRQLDGEEAAVRSEQAFTEARQLAEQWLRHNPRDALASASLAYYCAALGDRLCASGYLAQALNSTPELVQVHYLAALVYMETGDIQAATAAMNRAMQLGYPQILILTEPLLVRVWSDSRFATTRLSGLFGNGYQ
jgi:tetratricopeptide (TPR) repeat protein